MSVSSERAEIRSNTRAKKKVNNIIEFLHDFPRCTRARPGNSSPAAEVPGEPLFPRLAFPQFARKAARRPEAFSPTLSGQGSDQLKPGVQVPNPDLVDTVTVMSLSARRQVHLAHKLGMMHLGTCNVQHCKQLTIQHKRVRRVMQRPAHHKPGDVVGTSLHDPATASLAEGEAIEWTRQTKARPKRILPRRKQLCVT